MAGENKYVIISDFNIRSNNRGTAALGYGAIPFLLKNGYIDYEYEIIKYVFYWNPFRKRYKTVVNELEIAGVSWKQSFIYVWSLERLLYKCKLHFFNSLFKNTIKNVRLVAALNGGDGLTDIYGDKWLYYRLPEMTFAHEFGIPYIIMPQTIGPFLYEKNKRRILNFLKGAKRIYVRDDGFVSEWEKNGLSYMKEKDLSFYMEPIPFPFITHKPCVGINVSGLAYSNRFGNLAGQFDYYPLLMKRLVKRFQSRGCYIYLIPHSYNVNNPERFNDDLESSLEFYTELDNIDNVTLVDQDLISPQLKFLISQMDFFVGTRMHANFAAIFTGIPVFGLAYSYKFRSAFENNGIINRTVDINNISEAQVDGIIDIIERAYQEDVLSKLSDYGE